jgi:competence ComEA-like helix-hairpin-helix protein
LIDLNRQEAVAVLFLSGTLLVGTAVAVLDHLDDDQFEDFHVISAAVAVPEPASVADGEVVADLAPEVLSINRADVEQLQSLPHIGPKTAGAIVEYRKAHGPFVAVDDLRQVRGIGVATVERLRALVSID